MKPTRIPLAVLFALSIMPAAAIAGSNTTIGWDTSHPNDLRSPRSPESAKTADSCLIVKATPDLALSPPSLLLEGDFSGCLLATVKVGLTGGTLAVVPILSDSLSTKELNVTGHTDTGTYLVLVECFDNKGKASHSCAMDVTINVDDADADPTNEIQNLSHPGATICLTDDGCVPDNVDDADADPTNEIQNLSHPGATICLSGDGCVPDNVNDADPDPTNELQQILKRTTSPTSTQICLNPAPPGAPPGDCITDSWTEFGSRLYRMAGNVGIGTPSPSAKLHVLGNSRLEGNATVTGQLSIGYRLTSCDYIPVSPSFNYSDCACDPGEVVVSGGSFGDGSLPLIHGSPVLRESRPVDLRTWRVACQNPANSAVAPCNPTDIICARFAP